MTRTTARRLAAIALLSALAACAGSMEAPEPVAASAPVAEPAADNAAPEEDAAPAEAGPPVQLASLGLRGVSLPAAAPEPEPQPAPAAPVIEAPGVVSAMPAEIEMERAALASAPGAAATPDIARLGEAGGALPALAPAMAVDGSSFAAPETEAAALAAAPDMPAYWLADAPAAADEPSSPLYETIAEGAAEADARTREDNLRTMLAMVDTTSQPPPVAPKPEPAPVMAEAPLNDDMAPTPMNEGAVTLAEDVTENPIAPPVAPPPTVPEEAPAADPAPVAPARSSFEPDWYDGVERASEPELVETDEPAEETAVAEAAPPPSQRGIQTYEDLFAPVEYQRVEGAGLVIYRRAQ